MIVLMRNNCFLFAFAFVFMGLAGCRNKGVNVADDGVTVISVDLNESEKVSMSDIISRIEIVELEGGPDSYVVGPRWFKVSNGKYYMDSRQTEAVYAFDSDGTFLFSTAKRKGNGHNEYVALNGFHVDITSGTGEWTMIRMNVDDLDETVAFLEERGFHKARHDAAKETIDTGSSKINVMVSPSGYILSVSQHIKDHD